MMRFFIKKIPIIIPVILFISFEILFFFPQPNIFFINLVIFLASLIIGYFLFQERIKQLWPSIVHLFLFIFCAYLFALFLDSNLFIYHIYIFIVSLILFFILLQNYYLIYQPRLSSPRFFQESSHWLTLAIAFCFFSEIYALIIFYQISVWLFILPSAVVSSWLFYYLIWVKQIKFEKVFFPAIILSLIIIEFFLAFNFLPTHFSINGLLLSSFLVIIFNLWYRKQKKFLSPTISPEKILLK